MHFVALSRKAGRFFALLQKILCALDKAGASIKENSKRGFVEAHFFNKTLVYWL